MSLNITIQKKSTQAIALKDATLNEKINFVLRLLAFIKSNKSENFKHDFLLQIKKIEGTLATPQNTEASIKVILNVWRPTSKTRNVVINRPFEEIVRSLKSTTVSEDVKEKGVNAIMKGLIYLNNDINRYQKVY
ncbi:MAG: hypothetical protein HG467_000055 [Clostridiales bacterium]|nr:hypothetical protein [Clostridiales bacterium]